MTRTQRWLILLIMIQCFTIGSLFQKVFNTGDNCEKVRQN